MQSQRKLKGGKVKKGISLKKEKRWEFQNSLLIAIGGDAALG